MCSELHHVCKVCKKEYLCDQPDWVCPTLNFDENAKLCEKCEKEYYDLLISIINKNDN